MKPEEVVACDPDTAFPELQLPGDIGKADIMSYCKKKRSVIRRNLIDAMKHFCFDISIILMFPLIMVLLLQEKKDEEDEKDRGGLKRAKSGVAVEVR